MLGLVVIYGTRSLKEPWVPLRFRGTKHKVQSTKLKVPTAEGTYFPKVHHFETKLLLSWTSSVELYIWSRFAVRYHPPPPHGMVQNLRFAAFRMKMLYLQCFCMVGCWCGPQPCKFVGFLQPTFRKRVICNVSASTSWSSAAAPSSISVSNYHIILNLLLRVFSLGTVGTGLISVYILCLSNFLLEWLVFRYWSNLKLS